MKNRTIKNVFLTLIVFGSAISCNDYLDIISDPNNISIDNVTPNELLPVGITANYRVQARDVNQFANVIMNMTAGNSIVYGRPFTDYYVPNINNTFFNGIWDGLYRATANLDKIVTYNDPTNKYVKQKAIAKIVKANYIQILTDFYGDMPYSEAFKGQNNLAPKYDKGEDIYKASYAELENAKALIDSGAGDEVGAVDIVFGGDMAKWKAFANTLQLRYLLRMSNVTGDMATFRDQKLALLSGATFIDEDVLENPGYSSNNDAQQNPYTNYYLYTSSGSRGSAYAINVASENAAIILNGNPDGDTRGAYQKFNNIVDLRRPRMFTLIGGKVSGIRQGNTPGQPGVPSAASRFTFGINIGKGTPTSTEEYIDLASAKSGCIMTRAESKFLQAEAALRYPSLFSSALSNFNEGIAASFDTYGSAPNLADQYIATIAAVPGLGFAGSTTNKIDAIMTQKWIALAGRNPEQSFFDYSRTGFPVTLSATTASKPKPNRLMYPLSEFIANSGNVPKIGTEDVFSKNQYTPFWNRN